MSQQWVVYHHNLYNYSTIFLSLLCVYCIFTYVYVNANFNDYQKTYYILQWTSNLTPPLRYMGIGSSKFIELNCPYQNCYVTHNKTFLSDTEDFDAIVFNGKCDLTSKKDYLPRKRSLSQKFVFAMTEPVAMFIYCDKILENLFDWTWTYKLTSDIRWSYIKIYDLDGYEMGPEMEMVWLENMKPIRDKKVKAILDGKSKAAAWFVSRCGSSGKREKFVDMLKPELTELDLTLDVYGRCGDLECPKKNQKACNELVKRDYYFYLSFENSIATDYVTEKLLIALNNYAIPVVYGGANYSRFLPPGSYLNARELGPGQLARTMKDIIGNKTRFHNFFRWRNHYRYERGERDSEICNICIALNDNKPTNSNLRGGFRKWWTGEYSYRCFPNENEE
ncbi:alpha-(1,3)-fucosyltransferase C-like [Plodia interpunctella]|uniref:alpha-(1,3)-fucosyltransferase C-like n=1 Tax=Plodia interpunctella TaxID=58824 RepID=UPI0023683352|nr:alpha-(1,3)-fucosyltransferase C-like [Plodia interpunctella]